MVSENMGAALQRFPEWGTSVMHARAGAAAIGRHSALPTRRDDGSGSTAGVTSGSFGEYALTLSADQSGSWGVQHRYQ